jgi:GNAT superfamily N-acetyltransferase
MDFSIGDHDPVKLLFKISVLDGDEEEFDDWMETILVRCIYDGREIGRGLGRYVQRDQIRDCFWDKMNTPSEGLSSVAFELFDRYGRLKREFRDHEIRRGTGAWGRELDLGPIFVVEHVCVDRDWRRKGIGKTIVTSLMNKACAEGKPAFSLVEPGWLTRDVEQDVEGKTRLEQQEILTNAKRVATSLYRSLGFRRIGASDVLGLAGDPAHPAHAISSADDFNPVEVSLDSEGSPEVQSAVHTPQDADPAMWRQKMLQERLPLHHAVSTLPDNECLEFLKSSQISNASIDGWSKLDRFSENVLHVAAYELKARSVRWLLEHSNAGQTLISARDIDGYTPQEKLESRLESRRTQMQGVWRNVDTSDDFTGFPPEAVECLAALRAETDLSELQYAQLKYGCTCSSCIEGFLSPRMKFALSYQADMTHEILNVDMKDGEMWWDMHSFLFPHVAPVMQRNFLTDESYRQGYANIFNYIAATLRAGQAPTISNVESACRTSNESPPHTKDFLAAGGKVESALRTIFQQARQQDEWAGDGQHMEVFGEEINALLECRNDHEFGFVTLACGISADKYTYR